MSYSDILLSHCVKSVTDFRRDSNAFGTGLQKVQTYLDARPEGHVWTPRGISLLQDRVDLSPREADLLLAVQLWEECALARDNSYGPNLETFFETLAHDGTRSLRRPLWLNSPGAVSMHCSLQPGKDWPSDLYSCARIKVTSLEEWGQCRFRLHLETLDTRDRSSDDRDLTPFKSRYYLEFDLVMGETRSRDTYKVGGRRMQDVLLDYCPTPWLQIVRHLLGAMPLTGRLVESVGRAIRVMDTMLQQSEVATDQDALNILESINSQDSGLVGQIPKELLRSVRLSSKITAEPTAPKP